MKRNVLIVAIGVLLIAIFLLLLLVFQVRQSEVALVTTFGKPTRDVGAPGACFRAPWPIQRVYRFDQRIQNFEDKFTEDFTADSQTLMTMVYVGWRISDPKAFFPKFEGGSITEAQSKLETMLRNAKTAVVGRHPLSDFINADEKALKFDAIEHEMLAKVQSELATNNYGLEVKFLGLKKLGLPESVSQTVFDVMTKERNLLVSKAENEGIRDADIIKSTADRKAAETNILAEAEATRIRGQGVREEANSLSVFAKNPELAKLVLSLQALESMKENSTLFFDSTMPPFDILRGISTNTAAK